MRLYRKDGGQTEWAGINFNTVKNDIGQGGALSFTYRDPIMTNIATVKEFLNQRVEVKKDDGSTVIWEGVVQTANYSSINREWLVTGASPLRLTNDVVCEHNGLLEDGVVTVIDTDDTPPTITDDNKTYTSAIETKYASFTDITEPTVENIYPNSNTAFYNGGIAPDSATGSYTDLDDAGLSGMVLTDANGRATDYYGIDIKFTAPNQANAKKVIIAFYFEYGRRDTYAENGSDMPLVEIWDYDAGPAAYVIANEAGITGLGRRVAGWNEFGGSGNVGEVRYITITSNILRFFDDGTNECHVRVTMGNSTGTDTVACYSAKLTNTYTDLFVNPAYVIDTVAGSNLTFTGDTPYADGVRVGDTFKVGDTYNNIMAHIWRSAAITWADYSFDTTTFIDATDLRGSMVGSVLRKYAENLNWEVWDAIGWTITIDDPATSTSLSLTEANFISFNFGADGSSTTAKVVSGCQNKFAVDVPDLKGFPSYGTGLQFDNFFATPTDAADAGANYVTRTESIVHPFNGLIDMDDGTNYSAIELGKLITVTLYTDKHVFTEVKIKSVSYSQESGGHLYCQIKL